MSLRLKDKLKTRLKRRRELLQSCCDIQLVHNERGEPIPRGWLLAERRVLQVLLMRGRATQDDGEIGLEESEHPTKDMPAWQFHEGYWWSDLVERLRELEIAFAGWEVPRRRDDRPIWEYRLNDRNAARHRLIVVDHLLNAAMKGGRA